MNERETNIRNLLRHVRAWLEDRYGTDRLVIERRPGPDGKVRFELYLHPSSRFDIPEE